MTLLTHRATWPWRNIGLHAVVLVLVMHTLWLQAIQLAKFEWGLDEGLSFVMQGWGLGAVGYIAWRDRGIRRLVSPLWLPLLTLCAVFALSAWAQGAARLPVIALFGLVGTFAVLKAMPEHDPTFVLRALGSCVAIETLLEALIRRQRPGLFANPNEIASILILLLPYARWYAMPVLLVAIGVTESRAALIGLTVVSLYWVWKHWASPWPKASNRQKNRCKDYRVLRFQTFLPCLVTSSPSWAKKIIHQPFFPVISVCLLIVTSGWVISLRPETVLDRLTTWQDALRAWWASPVIGWGIGAYGQLPHAGASSNHADSLPLTLLAESGLVGLVACLPLLRVIGQRLAHTSHPIRWIFPIIVIQNLLDAPLYFPWSGLLLGVALAMLDKESVVENDHLQNA